MIVRRSSLCRLFSFLLTSSSALAASFDSVLLLRAQIGKVPKDSKAKMKAVLRRTPIPAITYRRSHAGPPRPHSFRPEIAYSPLTELSTINTPSRARKGFR